MRTVRVPEKTFSEPSSPAAGNRHFARQPILDCDGRIYAYELLFRSGMENAFVGDSDGATRVMLDNAVFYGIDVMAAGSKAFLNCTREALVDGLVLVLPPQAVVLEILETIEPDEEVIAACQSLKKMGYKLSLDDYVPREGMEPLVAIADYIKVDFCLCGPSLRREIRRQLQGSKAQLVAEKIEDEEGFQIAKSEGHELFQGYFFSRPAIIAKKNVCPGTLDYLKLLQIIHRSPVDWAEAERAVKTNPALVYRLMRLVNGGMYLVRREITSVKLALIQLGEALFRKLVTIAALPGMENDGPSNLIILALQRAAFCELLAPRLRQEPGEQYLFGLLSLFPLLLGIPVEHLLAQVQLRKEVAEALSGAQNEVSLSLQLFNDFERGRWESFAAHTSREGLSVDDVSQIYLASLREVRELLNLAGISRPLPREALV